MVSKLLRKKGKKNKRGSMLTLVLVIVAMSLIFITSAVMITNSTRTRYYDNVLSGQARLTVTAVAESFCSSINVQDIEDSQLETWCSSNATASVTNAGIPGANGATDTTTRVKFSKDSNYLYADFSTTIGTKSNGSAATENVRVYFKHKPVVPDTNLFDNLIEVGKETNFGGLNVGAGAPAGKKNTVFIHENGVIAETSGNTIFSDVICTGEVGFGNASQVKGLLLYAGPDACVKSMTGSIEPEYLCFVSPSGNAKGNTVGTSCPTDIDAKPKNVLFYNFNINGRFRNADTFYNGGDNSLGSELDYNGFYDNKMKATYEASNDALSAVLTKAVTAANDALKEESKFPTTAAASAQFLSKVPSTEAAQAQAVIANGGVGGKAMTALDAAGDTHGVYSCGNYTISNWKTCDLSKGPYIIIVSGTLTINNNAGFKFINGLDNNGQANWARIILLPGAKLKYADASGSGGIESRTLNDGTLGAKPHCYVFGYDNTEVFVSADQKTFEAYCGLYGDSTKITLKGGSLTLYGRLSCAKLITENSNGSNYPYCPGPNENVGGGGFSPATTNYDIVRFRYYYT